MAGPSVIRDFPKGCGRFAPRINGIPSKDSVSNGNDGEKLKFSQENSDIVESDPLKTSGVSEGPVIKEPELSKPSGISVRSKNRKFLSTSVQTQSPDLFTASQTNTDKPVKSSDQVEALEIINVEPPVVEHQKNLDQLLNLSKTFRSTTMESLKNLNEMELIDSKESSEKPKPIDVLESDAQHGQKDISSSSSVQSLGDSVQPDTLEPLKFPAQPRPSIPVIEAADEKMLKKYPPPRRVPASRDFPLRCGRSAPLISEQGFPESILSSKNASLDDRKPSVEHRPLEKTTIHDAKQVRGNSQDENSIKSGLKGNATKEIVEEDRVRLDGRSPDETVEQVRKQICVSPPMKENLPCLESKFESVGKKIDREVNSLVGKRSREFLKKDNSCRRKVRHDEELSGSVNQLQEESIDFETFDDRVIVLALMAAPFCPWRQEEKGIDPNTTNYSVRDKVNNLVVEHDSHRPVSRKRDRVDNLEGKLTKKKFPSPEKATSEDTNPQPLLDTDDCPEHDDGVQKPQELDLSLSPYDLHTLNDRDDSGKAATRNEVRETLRLFQAISRKLLQEVEAKSKKQKNTSKRIDLHAGNILKEKNKWVNTGKSFLGPVPGIEVGDEFHFRVELAVVGLHRPFQGGIDFVRKGVQILATSVVASGGYEDDMDSSDVLVYSGQGGNPAGRDKKAEDQKLERGNLSLKNSMDERSPVRVIRGFKEPKTSDSMGSKSKVVVTYIYDGLYLVENYWKEQGPHGTSVFKFKLIRIPGQPVVAWKEVKNSKKSKVRKGLCVADIADRKENMLICAINTLDDEKPPPFQYTVKVMYPEWYTPTTPRGCDCKNGCSDSDKCLCAVKNGGEIPFNHDRAIVEAKPLVYECGPSCKCPRSCHNRVSQRGIKFQLEIFKTELRGWGVRSLTSIPSGSFICEYTGELLEEKEAEQRMGNDEYLFDIGHNYNDHALWDGLSTLIPDLQPSISEVVEDVGFTIDAANYGSVGRFLNHSCSPNIYAQNVLYDHDDKRMPHIMFFAAENIPPLQELTYHYNYKIDEVRDSDGNVKRKSCYCGSLECTGRMY